MKFLGYFSILLIALSVCVINGQDTIVIGTTVIEPKSTTNPDTTKVDPTTQGELTTKIPVVTTTEGTSTTHETPSSKIPSSSTNIVPSTIVPTTVAPTTTTVAPPTPEPAPGVWTVNDTTNICIVATFAVTIKVNYTTKDGSKMGEFPMPAATVDKLNSNCENETQTLALSFNASDSLTLVFSKDDGKVIVNSVELSIMSLKTYLPDAITKALDLKKGNLTLFKTSTGHSYYCSKATETSFDQGSSIAFSDLSIEAFNSGIDTKFSLAEDCDGDVSNIVPIAVGCALAALVVVVLIAYLVGRRHKRQRGYESV